MINKTSKLLEEIIGEKFGDTGLAKMLNNNNSNNNSGLMSHSSPNDQDNLGQSSYSSKEHDHWNRRPYFNART